VGHAPSKRRRSNATAQSRFERIVIESNETPQRKEMKEK